MPPTSPQVKQAKKKAHTYITLKKNGIVTALK